MRDYKLLAKQMKGLLDAESFYVPALANAAALLWESLNDINWAGFYVVRGGRLVLGPFQGKTACIHIEKGRGVCGTAWGKDKTLVVADVHEFKRHIACDSASKSEIVIPIHKSGAVVGVLDIDSPYVNRFDDDDKAGLEAFARIVEESVSWE